MIKKKHVGRPTNEEVASRKNRKIIKFSITAFCLLILVGGIFLFINRDNIDFSSVMGASAFKRKLFVVDGYSSELRSYYDVIWLDTMDLNAYGYTSCKVSNKKRASCEVKYVDYSKSKLIIYAKKKGNVTVKVYGKNDKGKSVKKTLKFKIKDYIAPDCRVTDVLSSSVKRGNSANIVVTCNEQVGYTGLTSEPGYRESTLVLINYDSVNSSNCSFKKNKYYDYGAYVNSVKRLTDNSFMVSVKIPDSICDGKVRFELNDRVFADSNGNNNVFPIYFGPISIK